MGTYGVWRLQTQSPQRIPAAPSAPRLETGRQRRAGFLAPGSPLSFTFPRPWPQWRIERSLTGYSCGGSRGLNRVPFHLRVLKGEQYSELTLERASGYDSRRSSLEPDYHDNDNNHHCVRFINCRCEVSDPRRIARPDGGTGFHFPGWLRSSFCRPQRGSRHAAQCRISLPLISAARPSCYGRPHWRRLLPAWSLPSPSPSSRQFG